MTKLKQIVILFSKVLDVSGSSLTQHNIFSVDSGPLVHFASPTHPCAFFIHNEVSIVRTVSTIILNYHTLLHERIQDHWDI